MKIELQDIRCKYGDFEVIRGINGIIDGGIHALIGPNGSGKTTLLKCIAGILPYRGVIKYDGKKLSDYSQKEQDSLISYLPQFISPHVALTSYEVVLLGRLNSLTWRVGKKDHDLVKTIFRELEIVHLQDQFINELSGGQRQMVFLAQAMIKSPKLLLLDEPTNSLDLLYQLEVCDQVTRYATKNGSTVIVTLHDINLACRYSDNITILQRGEMVSSGKPQVTIHSQIISDVYQVKAEILSDSRDNLQIIPYEVIKKMCDNDE